MLPILYQQHVQYSGELARSHQVLGKQYKKLAKVERALGEREGRELSRGDRKKLQYTRSLAKRGIASIEMEQASCHQKLEQCNALIASYEQNLYHPPITPWTAQMPPSPFMLKPYSPISYSPWTSHTSQPSSDGQSETQPQYWDLSMLRERRQSSPFGSPADSGYHEPLIHSLSHTIQLLNATNHVFVHELLQPTFDTTLVEHSNLGHEGRDMNPSTENDEVPALQTPVSPARVGAESSTNQHKRCYSVDAAQLVSTHLRAPSTTKRGISVGPVSARRAGPVDEENTE